MKKNIIKGMVTLICLGGIYFFNTSDATTVNQLAFENIDEVKTTTFEIKNTGSNPLVIVDVSTTCGCTAATYDKEPAKPGELLRVEIG